MIEVLRGLLGIAVLVGLAWAMSSHKGRFPWRVVAWGFGLQLALAGVVLGTGWGERVLRGAAEGVAEFVKLNTMGASTVFGGLAAGGEGPAGFIFAFAATGLVVIIPFAALVGLLYHVGLMQVVIWLMARAMMVTMGVSGAEAMAMAANLFVGQTEAPLAVKPYLAGMTQSELMAMMTGGFATVAGSVLVVYMGVLGGEIGPHLLTASVLSAPAALAIAKVVMPEAGTPETAGRVELRVRRTANNAIEAAANGTTDGLKLYLNVLAMLVAFTFLIQFLNAGLGLAAGGVNATAVWVNLGPLLPADLSIEMILGVLLAPVAWAIGVESWHDARLVGSLIGVKLTTNEFVAFAVMDGYLNPADGARGFDSERSAKLAAYALCGFANFASIGIQIGGISPLAPERKTELSRLALRAMLGGAMASAATAAVAGMFLR
ncbi:MAG: nucleoside transporter C-terminal domain-containing protein [Planctomycetota bacterium]